VVRSRTRMNWASPRRAQGKQSRSEPDQGSRTGSVVSKPPREYL
jgi:hypothetical protein